MIFLGPRFSINYCKSQGFYNIKYSFKRYQKPSWSLKHSKRVKHCYSNQPYIYINTLQLKSVITIFIIYFSTHFPFELLPPSLLDTTDGDWVNYFEEERYNKWKDWIRFNLSRIGIHIHDQNVRNIFQIESVRQTDNQSVSQVLTQLENV